MVFVELKLLRIYEALFARFGPQRWWPGDSPWEIAVGAMLTQQVAWTNVVKAIDNLKSANLLELQNIINADVERVKELIKPVGFYNQKSKRLLGFALYVSEIYGSIERMLSGTTSDVREELLSIDGIGPETADSILLYGGNHPTFVVDAYTKRMARCLGIMADDYHGLKGIFESELPKDAALYNEYHALIVRLGKEHCKTKPLCSMCPVAPYSINGG